ncbi:YkyA family protein [Paenisporosarcina cavernae]|nr:YkyA family protein [Paenisporosarcina cavernae]
MKKVIISGAIVSSLLLAGCTLGNSVEDQVTEVLEATYEKEQGYRDAQEKLAKSESEESALFNEVMALTQEELEAVKEKTSKLQASLKDRTSFMKKENQSMEDAEKELIALQDIVKESKDEAYAADLSALEQAFSERYTLHDEVNTAYSKLLTLTEEMYAMLPDDKTEQATLEEKVKQVNEQNDVVKKAVEAFNASTKEVNTRKEKLYNSLESNK